MLKEKEVTEDMLIELFLGPTLKNWLMLKSQKM
jgi:hypothetical protein